MLNTFVACFQRHDYHSCTNRPRCARVLEAIIADKTRLSQHIQRPNVITFVVMQGTRCWWTARPASWCKVYQACVTACSSFEAGLSKTAPAEQAQHAQHVLRCSRSYRHPQSLCTIRAGVASSDWVHYPCQHVADQVCHRCHGLGSRAWQHMLCPCGCSQDVRVAAPTPHDQRRRPGGNSFQFEFEKFEWVVSTKMSAHISASALRASKRQSPASLLASRIDKRHPTLQRSNCVAAKASANGHVALLATAPGRACSDVQAIIEKCRKQSAAGKGRCSELA